MSTRLWRASKEVDEARDDSHVSLKDAREIDLDRV